MARIGCNDCHGCSSCCENMNGLIALDPYDFYRLVSGDKDFTFENLLNENIELTVDRGILVPTLKMREGDGKCTFLSEGGGNKKIAMCGTSSKNAEILSVLAKIL